MKMFSSKLYRIGVNSSLPSSICILQLKILLKRISFIVLKLLTIFRRGKVCLLALLIKTESFVSNQRKR